MRRRVPLIAWNVATWLAQALYGLVLSTLVVRRLGDPGFGAWAALLSFRGFIFFLDGGLSMGVVRDTAIEGDEATAARTRVSSTFGLHLVLAAAALLAGLALAAVPGALIHLSGALKIDTELAARLVACETAFALAAATPLAIARGRQRYDVVALVQVGQVGLGLGLLVLVPAAWGVTGFALASLVARVASAAALALWLGSSAPRPRFGRESLRKVLQFSLPLWVVAAATQLAIGTDVPVSGYFFGAEAAGHYALGAMLPAAAMGLLFAGTDASFPRLVASNLPRRSMTEKLMAWACGLGGLGFGALALNADALLFLWNGAAPALAVRVAQLYSATWALNVPAHILVLIVLSRSKHAVVAPLVVGEALLNLVLSVALAHGWRAEGPAVATLSTLALSNGVLVPWLLRERLGQPLRPLLVHSVQGLALGAASAAALWLALRGVESPQLRGVLVIISTGAMAPALVWLLSKRATFTALMFHGGWAVLLRERRERVEHRQALVTARAQAPLVWVPERPPLVTVRIATYNRGRLVAERSIASALAQSYRNLEVVVVGDHCDAATEAAVRSVNDPRLRFENLGERGRYPEDPNHRWMVAGSTPMNRGLELARGEWIAPLDDDDEFTVDHVEALLDACRTRELEFAYGIADMELAPDRWEPCGSWPPRHGVIVHSAVLYSIRLRRFTHSLDAWRLNQPGDWNLWRRMLQSGVKMGFVDHRVCRHYLEARELRTAQVPQVQER